MAIKVLKFLRTKFSFFFASLIFIAVITSGCSPTILETSGAAATQVAASTRPNIVLILVDDLGSGDVGYLGSEIKTPNIDTLAASGVKLDYSYSYPICSPTRAALMTGQNPLNFGIDGPLENDAMLAEQLILLPEYLRQGGYKTWMVGKWHLGMSKLSAMPQSRGFEYFYGFLGGFIDYYTHVYFGGLDWQRNGSSVREEGYATHLLTQEAVTLLTEHDSQNPFFLYLSYNSPHTPLQYPPTAAYDYSDIKSSDRRVYAQMTTDMDSAVGEVMETLKQRGLLDNTLVIFMSDNGGNLEAGASNGPLREGKGSVYEGGVRVPAVMAWPQGLQGKRSYQKPVFVQDWLPTLLEVAGIEYTEQEFDGRSVWPALANNEAISSVDPVVIGTAHSKAVYDWPWKLVRNQVKENGLPRDQLFNLEADPTETNNLAAEHSALVSKLGARLESLPVRNSKAARGPSPESQFRNSHGDFDYAIRKPETREPWAESAIVE